MKSTKKKAAETASIKNSFFIREASKKEDSKGFLRLLVALANYEHLEPPNQSARRRIIEDIFSPKKKKKKANLFVALDRESKEQVGYALYFFTYSSFLARPTLYLEDIFVLEEHRGRGIGQALFQKCVDEAKSRGCGRMEWAVLTWNKNAIKFYEKLGARRMTEWYTYRLNSEGIERLSATR